ncbi:MAG: hypothetical protein MZW92_54690 [Comamonadaceae bacterium]|nr:hypothetical protein [Comamonadaceae bacterium]
MVVIVDERPIIANVELRRPEGVRQGHAAQGRCSDVGIGEGLPFDRALVDRAEQEIKRQYLGAQPVRRRGRRPRSRRSSATASTSRSR